MSKNILIIGPAHPYRGGQALVEAYMHKTLMEMGYDTSTLSYTLLYPSIFFPGKNQYDTSDLIPHPHKSKITRVLNSINPFTWQKTYQIVEKENPDAVIFTWWMPFFGPALGFIAKRIKKYMPNTKVIFLVENYISHEKRWFDHYATIHTLKYADYFISESNYITQQIKADFPHKKVYETTLSVFDCYDRKKHTLQSARKELNIKTENVILFFGLIRAYKGLDKLIETFAHLNYSDTTLLIVGESYEDFAKYEDLIHKYNIQDHVLIVNDYIRNEHVEVYFRASDVVVLPYYSGTQSGVLMLAYGFGIPVISTDVGGVAELIIDNKTGLTVPDNAVHHLRPAIEKILETKGSIDYSKEIQLLTKSLGYDNLKAMFDEIFAQ